MRAEYWKSRAERAVLLDYLPVFFMTGLVTLIALATLLVSSWLRPKNSYTEKNQPYECGIDPSGEATTGQFKVDYFVVAILFIIFDVEALFLFPWAVVLKQVGVIAYVEMFVFIVLLVIGFAYAWVKGALEWES